MKKSYIQLFIVLVVLFVFLLLNSFVSGILSRYNLVICLLLLITLFKYVLGVEKDYHGFIKDIMVELLIFLLFYFIVFYSIGGITGFYRAGNYFNGDGITRVMLPLAVIVILKEILRYMLLMKASGKWGFYFLIGVAFVVIDVSNYLFYSSYGAIYDIRAFLLLCLIPSICSNVACSYMAVKASSLPNIVFQLVMSLYIYVLPIFPDMLDYFKCILSCVLSLLLVFRMSLLFRKYGNEIDIREYKVKSMIFMVVVVVSLGACYGLLLLGLA